MSKVLLYRYTCKKKVVVKRKEFPGCHDILGGFSGGAVPVFLLLGCVSWSLQVAR